MVDALATKGIVEPFPIQTQTIPMGLAGQDIIGQAKTGTGKTLGFGLPLLQSLGANPEPGVQALVVVPTRELCVQVAEDLVLASSNRATKVAAIYGGKAYEGQVEQSARCADDDLRAGLELFDLTLVGLAAVDSRDLGRAVGCGEHQVFSHLHAQLAGRYDDECLHAGLGVDAEALQHGEAEAEGLSRAGLGLTDDVLLGQTHGDGLLLNGERLEDALGGERVNHVLVDIEFCEVHVWMPVS